MNSNEWEKDPYTNPEIGRRLIATALNMDDMLVELLAVEIKKAKKLLIKDIDVESFSNLANLLKSVIMAMTLTENRIRDGIELCTIEKSVEKPCKEPCKRKLTTL